MEFMGVNAWAEGVACVSGHVTVQNLGALERDYAQPFIKPYNASARVNIP